MIDNRGSNETLLTERQVETTTRRPSRSPGSISDHRPAGRRLAVACDNTRILIVDDETAVTELFRMILSPALPELKIELANNGKRAVKRFSMGHHAVLIMDLHMPVMNGREAFGVIQKMCEDKNWEMPSVVFCTGDVSPDTLKHIVDENEHHCLLSKPITTTTILKTVKTKLAS